MTPPRLAIQGAADSAAPLPATPWAKRLHRRQQLTHAATTAAHTLRGDVRQLQPRPEPARFHSWETNHAIQRPQVRYADTPQPATPYQAAGRVWDERIGSPRVQAKNWRLMAFGCLALALLMAGGLVWRSARSIVALCDRGRSRLGRCVPWANRRVRPSDADLPPGPLRPGAFASIDPIVVRQNWLDAYNYTTKGAVVRNDDARMNDPFARIGRVVTVQITSVTRASDRRSTCAGRSATSTALDRTERWNAVISIVRQTPRTEQRLLQGNLGIVNGLSWARTRFIRRRQAMNPYFRKSVLPLILLATSVLFAGCAARHAAAAASRWMSPCRPSRCPRHRSRSRS